MKFNYTSRTIMGGWLLGMIMAGCTAAETPGNKEGASTPPEREPDEMAFQAMHPDVKSRVSDTGFDAEDQIGVFITEAEKPLEQSGNYVNNALLTYQGTEWRAEEPIYWNQGTYNVYAYYPFASRVASIKDYPFAVQTDQRNDGYMKSDFLWATNPNITASEEAVPLKFRHCMSRLKIRLVAGEDYEGELPEDAIVYIHNTVNEATVDLNAGIATRNMYAPVRTITARYEGNHTYGAIIVPQRLSSRRPLLEVVTQGVSYLMESTFVFKQQVCHLVTLILSKNPEQIKIEIGGEIEDWT